MITISLCMIVKNEEQVLERCLESTRGLVEQIVILDTGSTDRTKAIATQWTNDVYDFAWIDDFSAARNASFTHATEEYILWLDADDVLLEQDREMLKQLKETIDPSVDAVSMRYHCDFDTAGNVTVAVRRFRLVRRSRQYLWEGVVHEDLVITGECMDSDIIITHSKRVEGSDRDRNLNLYSKLLERGGVMSSRDLLHFAMELHHHHRYSEAIESYVKFLELITTTEEEKILVNTKMADCYYQLGDREKELAITFQSFRYDRPRPEQCCRLGYYFMEHERYDQAIYWYTEALRSPMPQNPWAIVNEVSRTWLPHMQLGNCYFKLGEYEQSYEHYQLAQQFAPNHTYLRDQAERAASLMSS